MTAWRVWKRSATSFPGWSSSTSRCLAWGGLELLTHIQAIDRRIPVIVLTGAADPRVPAQTLMQGASAYAPKPLSFKYLDQLVAMFLALPDEMTGRWPHLRS